ncbi:MAG: hypothetical protein SFU53_08445 [Terrimicrobiaceae bacterium]|nr:hypothetical protein [Terrimicrobiaceae bacterium]
MKIPLLPILITLAPGLLLAAEQTPERWAQPRELSSFQFLLERSPFSLPTAEESSPLADRYAVTGAVSINGEPLVFVMDRNTQERHMISKTTPKADVNLVEFLPDPDPKRMRATIRVNGEIATLSYSEPGPDPTQMQGGQTTAIPQPMPQPVPGAPPAVNAQPGAPAMTVTRPGDQQPPRRIIRRRIINGQPGQ